MESTILNHLSISELKNLIDESIKDALKSFNPKKESEVELLTTKEVSKILGVSAVTLNDWVKRGIIPALRIGTRIRYKKKDVLKALTQVETIKYRRG